MKAPPKLRAGRDGIVDPHGCPLGYDPTRYCDVELRKPTLDRRFWLCSKCGHAGMRADAAAERRGRAE